MLTNHQDIQSIIDGCLWINKLSAKILDFEDAEKELIIRESWTIVCTFINQDFANENDENETFLSSYSDENMYQLVALKLEITEQYENSFETIRTYLLFDFLESRHETKNLKYEFNEDLDQQ